MYIPRLGDSLMLTADWTFRLVDEYRNGTLKAALGGYTPPRDLEFNELKEWYKEHMEELPAFYGGAGPANGTFKKRVVLPVGTVLKVARIYIRVGNREYDSVSFTAKIPKRTGNKKVTSVRFFAKLDDVNTMEFDLVQPKLV